MRYSRTIIPGSATLAAVVMAVAAATASAAPWPTDGSAPRTPGIVRSTSAETVVYFTRGEQFAKLTRSAKDDSSLEGALRQLFAGPTPAELRRGIRSSIPAAARLHGVKVNDGVITIDVSGSFAQGSRQSLQTRLAQVVYTATAFADAAGVRITIDGAPVTVLGGLALEPPLTRATFAPVPAGGPPAAPPPPRKRSALVRSIQQRLIELSYLPPGAAAGLAGPQTQHAILAFQGWQLLPRDGRATSALKRRLNRAVAPVPGRGPARRIVVSLSRQVALLVDRGRTVRTIHVSTGKPSSPTPPGRFRVFRKELMSWSVPFRVWLPYASYFNRGIAFHESPSVPVFPASAGCVRIPASDSRHVYEFATVGTPVIVRRS